MSCFSTFIRILVGLVNVVFRLIGIALVVLTAVLRWGNVGELKNIKLYENVTVDMFAAINIIAIILLVIGGKAKFLNTDQMLMKLYSKFSCILK